MQNTEKGALYFVTEQACCLAQASGRETEDFRACRDAAEYLTDGDAGAFAAFRERTETVQHDATGREDYDTEQYEGKRDDVREAVSALVCSGTAPDTPEEKRGILLRAAELIAAFYDEDVKMLATTA